MLRAVRGPLFDFCFALTLVGYLRGAFISIWGDVPPSDSHYSQFVHVCQPFSSRLQDSAGERKYRGANKGERAERDGTGGCRHGGIPSTKPYPVKYAI